jgi:hypothetical protein
VILAPTTQAGLAPLAALAVRGAWQSRAIHPHGDSLRRWHKAGWPMLEGSREACSPLHRRGRCHLACSPPPPITDTRGQRVAHRHKRDRPGANIQIHHPLASAVIALHSDAVGACACHQLAPVPGLDAAHDLSKCHRPPFLSQSITASLVHRALPGIRASRGADPTCCHFLRVFGDTISAAASSSCVSRFGQVSRFSGSSIGDLA